MISTALLIATALAAAGPVAAPAVPDGGTAGAGPDRPPPIVLANPNLPKAFGKKFKVDCELCSDGSVPLFRGVRVTLLRDDRIALYGMSLAESSARGPVLSYSLRPGTVNNVFNLTSDMRDRVGEAILWRRYLLGAELRLSNRYVNPRLMLAFVRYEADLAPPVRIMQPSARRSDFFGLTSGGPDAATHTAFAIVPGLDTNFFGLVHLHAEAIAAYPFFLPTYGVFMGASINF